MITSYGYPGTITPGNIWAQYQWLLGSRYGVYQDSHLKVAPSTALANAVNVSTGWCWGWGVMDRVDATDISIPTTAAGSTEYYLIALRRTWQTTNATTLVAIDLGTTLPTTPSPTGRNTNPGTIDDQPLAIVSVTGTAAPVVVYDLRLISNTRSGVVNVDPDTPYGVLDVNYEGMEVQAGRGHWLRPSPISGNTSARYRAEAHGSVSLSCTANTVTSTTAAFSTLAGFTGVPIVQVTAVTAFSTPTVWCYGATTSGVTIYAVSTSTHTVIVNWSAFQSTY